MANRIGHITIVGGGTAGWLAASILDAGLNRRGDGPDVRITVIESPNVASVGVGEATTISMQMTLSQLNLDEGDFIKSCNGSFKCAVRFENWHHDADGSPGGFWQPFSRPGYVHGHNFAYAYMAAARRGGEPPYDEAMIPPLAAIGADRGPRAIGSQDYEALFPYAYHMDAKLFADYMTTYATNLGVEHVRDDVVGVDLDERGFVKSLALKERGAWPVEFVIDCTGFRGLIIREALGEPFLPYADHLLCDKALALQIPHAGEAAPIPAYTTSTGLKAGWSWRVPLYSRIGTGYVFSSAFASDDDAIAEFRAHLGLGEDAPDPRVIPMRIGRSRRSWVKNCLAVGLAGGFIEPLESTSIHFTQMALRWFIDACPGPEIDACVAESYNQELEKLYEEIRDFIVFHYCTSNRTDSPFWIEARDPSRIPDRLRERLAVWKHRLPGALECNQPYSLFENWNYIAVLIPKGFYDGITLPLEDAVSVEDYDAFRAGAAKGAEELMARAADHRALLDWIRGQDYRPWYNPVPFRAAPAIGAGRESAIA